MNKDLHDIDDLFRSALDAYEETPSARVKEGLQTALDKKDNESYKRKFIGWKRTVLLLLFLLTGFALYESGILKKSFVPSGRRTADKQLNYPSGEKHEETYQNNIVTGNKVDSTNKTMTGDNILMLPKKKDHSGNKIVVRESNPEKERSTSISEAEKKEVPGHNPGPHININGFLKTKDPLPGEKNNPSALQGLSTIKIIAGITNSIKQLQAVKDSLLKNNFAKNTKGKKGKLFKSFRMLTAFASYERAGYRLDSDLPTNITNIKHSEVHEPSFSGGILATRQLKKHWGFQTGIIYSYTAIGINPQKLYALQGPGGDIAFKYITSSGYAYIKPGLGVPPAIGDSLSTTEGKHTLQLIRIPVMVKFSVGKNKFTITPGAGIEGNFLTSAKVETEIEHPANPEIVFINKLDGAKSFHLSVVADAELRYKLNNKLSISLRPAIRFATSPITKNNVVETFPRSVGLGAGASIKF